MIFRMGLDDRAIKQQFEKRRDVREPLCGQATEFLLTSHLRCSLIAVEALCF
jgi:hypothetical protein